MVLGNELRDVVDAFSDLMAQHVRLARIELKHDARFFGIRLGLIAVFTPMILVGYGFLCIALALALRRVMGEELAFIAVGLVNLVIAGVGIAIAGRQLSKHQALSTTRVELQTSSAAVLPRRPEQA